MKKKIINLSIRVAILGGKFLSVIFLAKLMTVAEFGLYNLVMAYAAFAVLLYGFDFYAHTHRNYAKNKDRKRAIISHATYSFAIIFALSPLAYVFLRTEEIPILLSLAVMLLFALEYISQELYRYLVVEDRQIEASIGLLLRTTVWIMPLAGFGLMSGKITINEVIGLWLLGCGLSIIYYFAVLKIKFGIRYFKVSAEIFLWIFDGLKKSFKFLIATLALKLILTLDRKSVQIYASIEEVAVYGFSMSFAMVIFTIVDATVLSYVYPKILSENHDINEYKVLLKKILLISLATFPIVYSIMSTSVFLLNMDERYINSEAYTWASVAILFYTISMVPHYYLYSNGCDKSLVATHLLVSVLSIFVMFGIFRTGEASVVASKLALIMFSLFFVKHVLFNFFVKRSQLGLKY